jgi:hypothetical protein
VGEWALLARVPELVLIRIVWESDSTTKLTAVPRTVIEALQLRERILMVSSERNYRVEVSG